MRSPRGARHLSVRSWEFLEEVESEKVGNIVEYLNISQTFVSQKLDLCFQNYKTNAQAKQWVLNFFFPLDDLAA